MSFGTIHRKLLGLAKPEVAGSKPTQGVNGNQLVFSYVIL